MCAAERVHAAANEAAQSISARQRSAPRRAHKAVFLPAAGQCGPAGALGAISCIPNAPCGDGSVKGCAPGTRHPGCAGGRSGQGAQPGALTDELQPDGYRHSLRAPAAASWPPLRLPVPPPLFLSTGGALSSGIRGGLNSSVGAAFCSGGPCLHVLGWRDGNPNGSDFAKNTHGPRPEAT